MHTFRVGLILLGMMPLLAGCSRPREESAAPVSTPDRTAASDSWTWPENGIVLVKGRPPLAVATIEPYYDRTTQFAAQTPWGLVRVVWQKPAPYIVDGHEAATPMQYRTVVIDSPRRLPVTLRVHFGPDFRKNRGVIGVQVNGGDAMEFPQDPKPPHEFGIIRLRGGHSVVDWAEE